MSTRHARPPHSGARFSASAPVDQYCSQFADLYDLFYEQKPYREEAEFLISLFDQHQHGPTSRLLDIACGTGNHAFEMERSGRQVVAVDCSSDMLERARLKAQRCGSTVDFRCQDMRTLAVEPSGFDAAFSMFDSIGYVVSNQALRETLTRIRAHLRPAGLFIFEFWHAAAMLKGHDPVRVRRWQVADSQIVRISESQLDIARQTCQVDFTVMQQFNDGRCVNYRERHLNRFFSMPEMDAALTTCGFQPLTWHAGFSNIEPITDQTWHVLAVARRADN